MDIRSAQELNRSLEFALKAVDSAILDLATTLLPHNATSTLNPKLATLLKARLEEFLQQVEERYE